MAGGRPLLFKTPEELENKIEEWIQKRRGNTRTVVTKSGELVELPDPLPLTVSSLAVHLNTSRETLMNYQEREAYFDAIKRAKDMCMADAEDRLYTDFTPGVIFSMKNNYDWNDKQEVVNRNVNLNADLTEEEARKILKAAGIEA